LNSTPTSTSEGTIPITVNNNTVLFGSYISASTGLGGTYIDGGQWQFLDYYTINSGAGFSKIIIDIFTKSASNGAEKLLFETSTGDLGQGTVALDTITETHPAFIIDPSDRLVAKYYGNTDRASNTTFTLYYGGTLHYTRFLTPIVTRHNDLSGLQGGTGSERYHLTLAQATVVANTSGVNTGNQDLSPYALIVNVNSSLNSYVTNVSIGLAGFTTDTSVNLALGSYATNASINTAAFGKNASFGLYATNASVGLAIAPFATNASVGLAIAPFATNVSVNAVFVTTNASFGTYASNASVGLAIASFASNASVGLAVGPYATNVSVNAALLTTNASFGAYATNASVGLAIVSFATNTSIGLAGFATNASMNQADSSIIRIDASLNNAIDITGVFAKAYGGFTPLSTSTNYLVSVSDNNGFITADVSSTTIIFPNTLSVGFSTVVINDTTGIITLNASTLYSQDSSLVLRNQYAAATVICKSAGVFYAFGNLK
jgi:hypothetical protein